MSEHNISMKNNENLIKKLLLNIEEATQQMSCSFEQGIIRHEQQFMKCFKIKIWELVKLFEELKNTIQDRFINNTLSLQLETVSKERDYFKYECLKLNSQHQTLREDYKNTTAQANNAQEQIYIYQHLLETAKIKNQELEQTINELKNNFNSIAFQPISPKNNTETKFYAGERELSKKMKQLRDKNQIIRALRQRVHELEKVSQLQHDTKIQKKQLFELFKVCVESWKRELMMKGGKQDRRGFNLTQLTSSNKKQLLRILFTHDSFLKFIQRLLFDQGFKVTFESVEENYMARNRSKLMDYMKKHRVSTASKLIRQ